MKGKNAMGEILPKQWLECGKVPEESLVWEGLSTGRAENVEKIEKTENLPEDMVKDNQDKVQKLTDKYVGIIDSLVSEKEKEVMTV